MKQGALRIGSSGAIVCALLAGTADAATKTKTVSSTGPGVVAMSLFDPALGTLLSVYAEAAYNSTLPYTSFMTPVGYDHAVTGTAVLGSLTFAVNGASQATQYSGNGVFTVSASGNATWTSPTEINIFAGSTGTVVATANAYATSPGLPMPGNFVPTVNYKLTYTYDDNTPAVPEPTTWAMMAGGFALMGVALRSARRSRARVGGPEADSALG